MLFILLDIKGNLVCFANQDKVQSDIWYLIFSILLGNSLLSTTNEVCPRFLCQTKISIFQFVEDLEFFSNYIDITSYLLVHQNVECILHLTNLLCPSSEEILKYAKVKKIKHCSFFISLEIDPMWVTRDTPLGRYTFLGLTVSITVSLLSNYLLDVT